MDRIAPRRVRARRASALALALAIVACGTHAATEAATPAASMPRPPHQATPDAPLYPDYYALALEHTSVKDDATWRPLHLETATGRVEPAFIVLPVQTQAYGFAPTFRALLGARLDQELQRRQIDSGRQTDVVDWRGPFVRRSDDATVATFAAEHPRSALLTLYVGHDADGHAFLTLGRTEAGKTRLTHRRIDIAQEQIAALDAFTNALPPMLAELGLGDAKPAPALPAGAATGCDKTHWNLDDVPATAAPMDIACHALLMGTLLPDFLSRVAAATQPSAPDRLAWLARAWVEADALAPRIPAMRSAATLASLQLRLVETLEDSASLVDDQDAVVRPLARLLWARKRAAKTPQRSRNDATDSYIRDAVAGLPPFASAVAVEHAGFTEGFRKLDLCAMQLALPHFKRPADCEDDAMPNPHPVRAASRGQLQLVADWRVAAAWVALDVEGNMRGSATGLADVLRDMSPRIAAHPIVRTMRYAVSDRETPAVGAQAHLAQSRSRILDYAQAVATLQRDDALIRHHDASDEPALELERKDPTLSRARDDLQRLSSIERLDFWAALLWRPERLASMPATYMTDGNFKEAERAAALEFLPQRVWPRDPPSSLLMPGDAPAQVVGAPVYLSGRGLPLRDALAQTLANNPSDMAARTTLALIGLEHGASVAEVRHLIDARPAQARVEDTIVEANDWSVAAHMFYFAGALEAARFYYARAASYATGSESDLMARVRIAAIDGDVRGAFERTRQRVQRYGSEWAIADEAGYLFMLRRPVDAWHLIVPRMQTSTDSPLWRSAMAGHRIAGDKLDTLPTWLQQNQLERVRSNDQPIAPAWLLNYAIIDRLPTPSDAALLKDTVLADSHPMEVGGALVARAAINSEADVNERAVDTDMGRTSGEDNDLLLPFHAWALWNASNGQNRRLELFRNAPLESGFQPVLAKALVLAADGQRAEALRFLTAARWELGRNGSTHAIRDPFRTAPYDFVLASWLMARKTGDQAYADQGLEVARAYQHVVEYMAWPYAAEALLSRDPKARAIAACRALALDPASMFLHESGLHPDPKSAVCVKATAW